MSAIEFTQEPREDKMFDIWAKWTGRDGKAYGIHAKIPRRDIGKAKRDMRSDAAYHDSVLAEREKA